MFVTISIALILTPSFAASRRRHGGYTRCTRALLYFTQTLDSVLLISSSGGNISSFGLPFESHFEMIACLLVEYTGVSNA
jgi:hypothetical protein